MPEQPCCDKCGSPRVTVRKARYRKTPNEPWRAVTETSCDCGRYVVRADGRIIRSKQRRLR